MALVQVELTGDYRSRTTRAWSIMRSLLECSSIHSFIYDMGRETLYVEGYSGCSARFIECDPHARGRTWESVSSSPDFGRSIQHFACIDPVDLIFGKTFETILIEEDLETREERERLVASLGLPTVAQRLDIARVWSLLPRSLYACSTSRLFHPISSQMKTDEIIRDEEAFFRLPFIIGQALALNSGLHVPKFVLHTGWRTALLSDTDFVGFRDAFYLSWDFEDAVRVLESLAHAGDSWMYSEV